MYYASICAIAKDETLDLREWVTYHLAIGFEHIFLYDNNSKIAIRDTLSDFINSKLVTVINLDLNESQQLSAYYNCIKLFGDLTFWLAFIDIDEFIVPLKDNDVKDVLDDYKEYAGLGVHWMIFSSNSHIKRPKSPVIYSYIKAIELNKHIKSIIQPKHVISPISPHHFKYKNGYFCVNEEKFIIPNFQSYPIANKIRINHYYYKSQEDFEDKIKRGLATKSKSSNERDTKIFYNHLNLATFENTDILRLKEIYDKFNKLTLDHISSTINRYSCSKLLDQIKSLSRLINNRNLEHAQKLLNRLKRYHKSSDLDLLELYFYITKHDHENVKKLFSKCVQEYTSNYSIIQSFYNALSYYYKIQGRTIESDSIKIFINKQ